MALAVVGLYACGGENPTATAVPPSPTPLPPTPTVPAVTPTSAAAATAGTGDVALIQEAVGGIKDLKSYHFTMDVQPSDFITQPVHAEGDYIAPNTTYVKGKFGDQNIEEIVINDKVFVKGANGQWTEQEKQTNSGDPTQAFNPQSIASSGNPLEGIGSTFEGIKTYKNEGNEKINGVQTTKYSFKLDLNEMMGGQVPSGMDLSGMSDMGGGALWVDPSAKNVQRIDLNLNLGPIMQLLVEAFSGLSGTPTPGGAQATPFPQMAVNMSMTISKQNDPSINIPLTAEMKAAQAAPTAEETFPTEEVATPEAMSTEEVATPEGVETVTGGDATPEAAATEGSSTGGDQVVKGKIGDTLTLGDTTLTVTDVKRTTDGNLAPSSGNEYVMITVDVANNSKEDLTLSGLLSFVLTDSAGKDQQFAIGAKYANMFDTVTSGTIKAGSKATGELGYEVAKGSKPLTLKFMPDILNSNKVVEVTIDK